MKYIRPRFTERLFRFSFLTVLLLALLSACGGSNSTPSGPVEVTYRYADFNNGSKDYLLVQDAMNKILSQSGVKIKLMPIAGGSYDQKLTLLFSARESCDIVWTAPWIGTNSYTHLVSNGDLHELDDLLSNEGQDLYKTMTPAMWNAARIDGKIYAVPNQQIFVKPFGMAIRKDIAQKYNVDVNAITKWEDLEPVLDKLKADGMNPPTPGLPPFQEEYQGWDPLGGYIAVKSDDKALKAFSILEQPEYRSWLDLIHRWRQKGYVPKDDLSGSDSEARYRAGKFTMVIGQVVKPGGEQELKGLYGYEWEQKALATPLLTTGAVTATLNGICANSKHPEAAMKVLNLINTNKTVYNLLAKGVENKHWVFKDKANGVIGFPDGVTAANATYNPGTDWMFGNQFNAYYSDESQVGSWEKTKELNTSAKVSPALGFTFDTSNLQTQLAQMKSVSDEFATLTSGRSDPAQDLPKFIQRMKAAGLDQVLTEAQSQLDAWKAKS